MRVARYRQKQRAAGMATISLVVPACDVELFKALAAERKRVFGQSRTSHKSDSEPGLEQPETVAGNPVPDASGSLPENNRKQMTGGKPRSRAETLANKIVQEVVAMGWPVGKSLGTEPELMATYNVSRAVLRQTIRLLQQLSIARMQRGAQGGLVVTRPELDATVRAVNVMLEYMGIKAADIYNTRKLLESAIVKLAIDQLDATGTEKLLSVIQDENGMDGNASAEQLQRFHVTLAELSGDPALAVFARIILDVTDSHSRFSQGSYKERDAVVARIKGFHREIANDIVARDRQAAIARIEKYIDGLMKWMR